MVSRLLSANVATDASSEAAASRVAVATQLITRTAVYPPRGNDAYSTRQTSVPYTTPVWDYPDTTSTTSSDDVQWEYAYSSSWAGHDPQSPAAQYLLYSAMSTSESGQLVNVYA